MTTPPRCSPAADSRIYYVRQCINNSFNSWAIMTLACPLRKRSSQRQYKARESAAGSAVTGKCGQNLPRSWNLITRARVDHFIHNHKIYCLCVQLHNIKSILGLRVSISRLWEKGFLFERAAIKPKGFQQAWSKYQFTVQRWIPSLSSRDDWLAPQARA